MVTTEVAKEAHSTKIQKVLNQYPVVFTKLKGFPPQRVHDHHIPFKEGSQPVNHRPYRYPLV